MELGLLRHFDLMERPCFVLGRDVAPFELIVFIDYAFIYPVLLAQGYLIGESKGAEPRGRSQGQCPAMRNSLYFKWPKGLIKNRTIDGSQIAEDNAEDQ